MSSEAERIFSKAKNNINDGCSSPHIDTIEALECLRSWFWAEICTQEDLSEAFYQQPHEI